MVGEDVEDHLVQWRQIAAVHRRLDRVRPGHDVMQSPAEGVEGAEDLFEIVYDVAEHLARRRCRALAHGVRPNVSVLPERSRS